MTIELDNMPPKPCPFCGMEVEEVKGDSGRTLWLYHPKCDEKCPLHNTNLTFGHWNLRTSVSDKQFEAMEELIMKGNYDEA